MSVSRAISSTAKPEAGPITDCGGGDPDLSAADALMCPHQREFLAHARRLRVSVTVDRSRPASIICRQCDLQVWL